MITRILSTLTILISLPLSAEVTSFVKREFRTAHRLAQKGQHQEAIEHFEKIQEASVTFRDYILFYLGKSLLEEKRCGRAREVFDTLLRDYPDSRWSRFAAFQVEHEEKCPPLVEFLQEVTAFQCGDLFGARGQADCFFESKRYVESKELYRVLAEKAVGEERMTLLKRYASSASRSQDYETAIAINERIRSEFSDSQVQWETLRKLAYLHEMKGEPDRAVEVIEQLQASDLSVGERSFYRERLAWNLYRQGKFERALNAFNDHLRENDSSFSLYWRGRSLEKLKKKKEAKENFKELVIRHPRSYYAVRALEYLSSSFKKEVFREWWSPRRYRIRWHKEAFSMGLSPLLQRIEELHDVGLEEDARIEGRRLRAGSGIILPFEPKKIRRKKEGYFFKVYTLRNETPDYPLPYGKFLFKSAKEFDLDVDPIFLFAMMRQESHYREDVVSPAGAIGLLQIMPATGRRLAKEAGWRDYRPDWLYDPYTNIELSLRYIGELSQQFDEKWYLMAGAYNAGEKVIERWLPYRKESEEEELIEMIPYDETRDYVKKIYRNYKAYRWIYK